VLFIAETICTYNDRPGTDYSEKFWKQYLAWEGTEGTVSAERALQDFKARQVVLSLASAVHIYTKRRPQDTDLYAGHRRLIKTTSDRYNESLHGRQSYIFRPLFIEKGSIDKLKPNLPGYSILPSTPLDFAH
jgi:hypothetical protein